MPQRPNDLIHPRTSTSSTTYSPSGPSLQPEMLASPTRPMQTDPSRPQISRPTLPPLKYFHTGTGAQFPASPSPAFPASYSGTGGHVAPSQYTPPNLPHGFTLPGDTHPGSSGRGAGTEYRPYTRHPTTEPLYLSARAQVHNPLKRPHETSDFPERPQYGTGSYPAAFVPGDVSESRKYRRSTSASNASTPTMGSHPTFGAHHQPFSPPPSATTSSNPPSHRCSLYLRQQPRAARAGPDGKDRRPIDPPPVLQLLMADMNVNDEKDVELLHSRYWVCHCRLVSANSPRRDVSTLASTPDDGHSREMQRLLLGTHVASPTHTKDDPDPPNMPLHPITLEASYGEPMDTTSPEDPPSPTTRFIPRSASYSRPPRPPQHDIPPHPRAGSSPQHPATFFIFPDISVRKAGEYRLEFCLMFMDPESLSPGYNVPIISLVASQVFKVVNAKDFDQVRRSTKLVRGLLERGAGFPLKLKKGTRGQGGRGVGDGASDDDEDGGGGGAEEGEDYDDDDDSE